LLSRGPLAQLKQLGGTVVYDETTGYGHAVWDYKEGNERAEAWAFAKTRPASREIRRLDFTALDGVARRAWWAEIVEFGAEPEPAHFVLQAEADNTLVAELRGVRRLGLRLAESPFDASKPLRILTKPAKGARGQVASSFTLAPRAEPVVVLDVDPVTGQLSLNEPAPALAFRLRTPGGANQLYAGEPLLIVYGTRGSAELRRAQKTAALVAAESSRAEWWEPSDDKGPDGVSHNLNLYGSLPVKADTEVTDADLARHHLVLIGSASQSSVVARIAAKLPVSYADGQIRFSDGTSLPSEDRALGLVHYNPQAPDRLIFWVATDHAAAYAAGSLVPELMGSQLNAADLVVASVAQPALVLARSFDSHWRWRTGRADSALLPVQGMTQLELGRAVARALRAAAHTDFALAAPRAPQAPAYTPGITRLSDLLTLAPYAPLSVMRLSGQELLTASRTLERGQVRFEPPATSANVSPQKSYSVALTPALVRAFVPPTHLAPRDYRNTELTLADALRKGLPQP
jgi:hypothetical protein